MTVRCEPEAPPRLMALEAVQDLRDVRDAYGAVVTLLDTPTGLPVPRDQLVELLLMLNTRFDTDLARAEAALRV